MYFWSLFLALILSMFTASQAKAADNAVSLGEVVVTATKTETPLKDVPASVTVITKKDMEDKHLVTIDKALENEAGVYVRRTKGLMDTLASVTLRGIPYQKRTLILLDGVPINDGYYGGVPWNNLSTYNIDRIEVVRGAYSALWGGNAMGGVVSLFTELPTKLTYWAKGGFGGGESVTQGYRLGLGNRIGDVSFLLGFEKDIDHGYSNSLVLRSPKSGSGTLMGGYPMLDKTGTELKWVVGDKGDNWGRRENYNAALGWTFSPDGFLKLSYQHGWSSYGYGPPHTYVYDPATDEPSFSGNVSLPDGQYVSVKPSNYIYYTGIGRNQTDLWTLNAKNKFGKAETNVTLGYIKRDKYYTTTKTYTKDYYTADGNLAKTKADTFYTDLNSAFDLFANHLLTVGITYRLDKADTKEYDLSFYRDPDSKGDETYRSGGYVGTLGLFAQDKWALRDDLDLFLGLRYDHWWTYNGYSSVDGSYPSRDTGTASPKIALVWNPLQDTTLRLSYGKAFRAPNVYELYRTWVSSWGTTYHANPNLDPEKAYTTELSLTQKLWDGRLNFEASIYSTKLEDLIYRKSVGSDKYYINAGEGRIYGFEAGIKAKPTHWLNLGINYTRNDTKITSNPADPSSEGKRFVKTPPWIWNFNIGIEMPKVTFAFNGHYVGKVYHEEDNSDVAEGVYATSEDYFVADLKTTVYLPTPSWLAGDRLALSLSINNLFDKDYFDYYKAPGRSWFLSLELKR
ncbi:TonB-dependent receptor plug [Thermodesulfatator indicus DSM 15286]|uniref:TonB-dependent receptor plug n=1 Tax=Thermodesulfatator indicus (strain DSM 15286 / JCM 11887 / CIR29812) TaxID=667014 RepID=F8ABE6_THEID|nr:TonB-dependent receptor [Thermodesulfatator indicus]AEH44456.1 TonB-dependent receptor plug [Thermodesulfatator indicus DSM 15286]